MPDILNFCRNRCTFVEQLNDSELRSVCQLTDTLTEAKVEIMVKLPDLELIQANASFTRSPLKTSPDEGELVQKVIGIRIGPGMKKIIKGLLGDRPETKQLAFMVEECCNAVILSFTKDVLIKSPRDKVNVKEFYNNMVKENIRLYNRCAAFAPGSSLVEGIEPPN